MGEISKEQTAFSTCSFLYQCKVLPFGVYLIGLPYLPEIDVHDFGWAAMRGMHCLY